MRLRIDRLGGLHIGVCLLCKGTTSVSSGHLGSRPERFLSRNQVFQLAPALDEQRDGSRPSWRSFQCDGEWWGTAPSHGEPISATSCVLRACIQVQGQSAATVHVRGRLLWVRGEGCEAQRAREWP